MIKVLLKKFFIEDNLLVIINGFIIMFLLIGFLIFGLLEPSSTYLKETPSQTQLQQDYEEAFLTEFNEGDYSAENPYFVIDPYHVSPLSGLMMFETNKPSMYKVVILGKTSDANIEFITPLTTSHYIPIYGLYAGHFNTIKLYQIDFASSYYPTPETLVSEVNVLTDQLPESILTPSVIDTTYEYFGNDLMMLMPALGTLPVAYDFNGEVRWYLSTNLTWAPTLLENGHLLLGTNRVIASPYYTTGLYEIDFLGKIYTEYILPGGYHHDVYEMSNGNLLVGTSDFDGTVEDVIVEINRQTGEIVKSWDLADYLPKLDGMAEMWTTYDWFHNNSIAYDEVTDSIILSGRHQDAVISIGYSSNELNWVIGDPTNWGEDFVKEYFFTPLGDFEWSYAQHSATVLENGNIFLFDNGNNRSKLREFDVLAEDNYSRGVIYNYDMITMTIFEEYQFGKELGEDFYSPYISNVYYYADGNYLIHSGGHSEVNYEVLNIPAPLSEDFLDAKLNSITIEVQGDEVVYRLEVASNFYRAKRISLYTDETSFNLGPAVTLGNFLVTSVSNEEFETVYNFFVTVPKNYELNLEKESDRLVISAVFDHHEVVYAVLVSDNERLVYNIPTGSSTYTAMCTVVSDGDDRKVSFYINEEGLSGTYKIYLYVDGQEYNTYQKVNFK